jgi:arylsulfatase A-like enzyme
MDGRSLLSFARHPSVERGRELLIEEPTFEAIRTQRYMYAEYRTGERELYDLKKDPFELQSRHDDPASPGARAHLATRLHHLEHCAGRTCRRRPQLSLQLRHRHGRQGGRPCARAPIRALVRGKDAHDAERVEFYVGAKRVAVDTQAPFRHRLPGRAFARHGKTRVRARPSMLDGRRMTIDRKVRACR